VVAALVGAALAVDPGAVPVVATAGAAARPGELAGSPVAPEQAAQDNINSPILCIFAEAMIESIRPRGI
jgi:hypothetical protein